MDQLEREGFRVKSLLLASVEKVPDDANVLAVIGPKNLFSTKKSRGLRRISIKVGSCISALTPTLKQTSSHFWQALGWRRATIS